MPEAENEAVELDGQSLEESPGRPDWLESNFETVEAQARAYRDARSEMQRAQRDRAQSDKMLMEFAEQMSEREQETQAPAENALAARFQQALDDGDGDTALALMSYVANEAAAERFKELQKEQWGPDPTGMFANMVEQTALQRSGLSSDEWYALKEEWKPVLQERPYLLPATNDVNQAVDGLLWLVESVRASKGAPPPRDNTAAAPLVAALTGEGGLDSTQAKRLAATMHGAGVRTGPPPTNDESYWERVKSAETGGWQG